MVSKRKQSLTKHYHDAIEVAAEMSRKAAEPFDDVFHPKDTTPRLLKTFAGLYLDLNNPHLDYVELDIAHALSLICRFGGHCDRFYSVAQHSILVSHLCPERFKLWGLLHDASEAYLGDMPRPLKAMLPDYRNLESKIQKLVWEEYDLIGPLPEEVKKADEIALSYEYRLLMGVERESKPEEWPQNPEVVLPFTDEIYWITNPMTPEEAETDFLSVFYDLVYFKDERNDPCSVSISQGC